ncbi:MAG: hypothetical protein IJB36_03920 [Clostridia bacterium]|nr:hypothetical protein [Clostridia bacterium]
MNKILYLRDVQRVIKDYFIECVNADMDAVELTEANAELCQRMEGVAFGLPGSRELQYLLCKVECIGGEEPGNCPERRFGRCRSIERLESCQIYAITDYLLSNGVIVPPCRVGDTVWYELYGKIESAVVYSCVGVFKKQGVEITDANAKSSDGLEVTFTGKCIGKTIFLTEEEAIAALKAKGGGAE